MRIRRKTSSCLNCGRSLSDIYNYCPHCGQENDDKNISTGKLANDFLSNYFALDSKLGRSIKPFFIKPGYLTNRFNEGKRASYVNPIRLYLILSLFFFFLISQVGRNLLDDEGQTTINSGIPVMGNNIFSPEELEKLDESMTEEEIEQLESMIESGSYESLSMFMDSVSRSELESSIRSTDLRRKLNLDTSRTNYDTIPAKLNKPDSVSNISLINTIVNIDWGEVKRLDKETELSDAAILDSVTAENFEERSFKRKILVQSIRISRAKKENLIGYVLQNLPIMMFFLLPIFALYLKLLYIRRKQLYIKHLIHALHLHSFAYLSYGLGIFLMYYVMGDNGDGWTFFVTFLLVTVYAYISFLRVYGQSKRKTLVKFWVHGFLYFSTLTFSLILEVLISTYFY